MTSIKLSFGSRTQTSNLEITLMLNIRLDAHIQEQFKANIVPPRPPPPKVPPPPSKGGVLGLFGHKKPRPQVVAPTPPPPKLPENLARYLKPDGILARTFVSFSDIAHRCDAQLFESSFPLIGQKSEASSPPQTVQIGEMALQFFRLPPLPGVPSAELPQSLGDCHRGLRHIEWHKQTYMEGTLTQNGGDCMVSALIILQSATVVFTSVQSWRRRRFRIVGASLTAFNDVTRKPISSIDLNKAVAVEDDQEAHTGVLSPESGRSSRTSRYLENDGLYGIGRSFRLLFNNNEEVTFFADTEEEKAEWCAYSHYLGHTLVITHILASSGSECSAAWSATYLRIHCGRNSFGNDSRGQRLSRRSAG